MRPVEGWRYTARSGDFELDTVALHDVLVNVVSADFRPFSLSILSAKLPRLRKRYLLYDILRTESAVGLFDNCLYSFHTPQVEIQEGETRRKAGYDQIRHLKIDGVNVDHFISSAAVGPLSWLQRGTVDIDAFVQLPPNSRKPSEDFLDSLNVTLDSIRESLLVTILKKEKEPYETSMPSVRLDFIPGLEQARERLRKIRQEYAFPVLERFRKRTIKVTLQLIALHRP